MTKLEEETAEISVLKTAVSCSKKLIHRVNLRELRVLPDLGPGPSPYLDLTSDPVCI
jgi:hypothetical protein